MLSANRASVKVPDITIFGHTDPATGLGRSAHGLRRAITATGRSCVIKPWSIQNEECWSPIVVSQYNDGTLERPRIPSQKNVAYWVYETSSPFQWQANIAHLYDAIWGPSVRFSDWETVPHIVEPLAGARPRVQVRKFLIDFNSHSRWDRKNPDGSIRAWMLAVGDRKDCTLTIKAQNCTKEQLRDLKCISRCLDDPRVSFITGKIQEEHLQSLYRNADCLISLTRGEGFGLVIAEAMADGVIPIVPMHSAPDLEVIPINSQLIQAGDEFKGYWMEPDLFCAADKIKELIESPREDIVDLSTKCHKHIKLSFSEAEVASRADEAILKLYEI